MESHREAEVVRTSVAVREVVCEVCSMTFRRESDCKRHKCVAERRKPVSEQRGSVQVSDVQEVVQEQGRFSSPCVQTRRLSAAGSVSCDTCCPFGSVVAV